MADEIKLLEVDVAGLAKSIQNAKVELDSLRIALDATTEAEGKNSEATTIAKAAYDAQNKSVKQLEGALLRVTQAEQALGENIQDIVKGYDASTKSVDQNRKVLNALTAEYNRVDKLGREKLAPTIKKISDELKAQEGAIGDTRRNVGNYAESFKGVFNLLGQGGGVFGNAIQSVQGLNTAFAANPILGVVAALQQLYTMLATNKEIMDALEVATAYASATFNVIIQRVVSFGKSVYEALSNPKKLIEDFGTLIKENIENRFKAFGLIVDAIAKGDMKALGNAFFQLGTGVTDITGKIGKAGEALKGIANDIDTVAKANAQATKAQQELDDAIRSANVSQAQQEVTISKLIKQSKDRTKSDEDRIKLLDKALKLELARAQQEEQIAVQQVKIYEQQFKGLSLTDEQENKLSQARVQRFNAQKQTFQLQEKIQNEINALEAEIAKEREARILREIELQNKAFADERTLREFRLSQEADSLDKRLKLFDLNSEQQEQKLREAGATEIEITNWRNNEIKKINDKFNEEQLKAKEETVDKENKIVETKTETNIGQLLSFVGSAFSQIGSLINESNSQQLEDLQAQSEAGLITQEEFNKRSKELKQQAFEETKALNIVNAVISTAQAVLNAYNSGLQAGGPAGPAVGAVFAGIAAAIGAAQIGIISAQQPPKFAEGGSVFDVGGKSHSQGGTKYVGEDGNRFEVERGEKIFVMKATASKYIDALGGVNMMFGGRSWGSSSVRFAAQGGAIQDGGFVARNTTQRADELATQKALISTLLKSMPAPVVSVQEINKVNNGRNKSVAVSEL